MVCAALLGYRPEIAALAACGDVSADVVVAALGRASQVDLTVEDTRGPAVFRFRHALTQAALRDALEPETRRLLHAKIAKRLEGLDDATERVEQLAHHWLAAGEIEKAGRYWQRAAERARLVGADGDAETFAARAREASAKGH